MNISFDNIPIRKLVFRLGIPAMFAQFFNILYSIVDRMFVGNIPETGDLALASIGVCAPALASISAISYLVGIGGSSFMSISIGKREYDKAKKIISDSLQLLLYISITVTILCLLFKKQILYTLGCSDLMYPYANSYFTVYILGTAACLLGLGMNYFILAQGFAKQGMISVALGAIVNVLLDPLFIYGFDFGITGAAIATVISQTCSMAYVFFFLFGKSNKVPITFKKMELPIVRRILALGTIPFFFVLLDSIIVIFLNMSLRRYGGDTLGDTYISAAAIVQSFMFLITCPAQGITTGCSTLYSYHYGAGNYDKIMQAFRYVFVLCTCYVAILFVAARTCPGLFVQLFTNDPAMIELSKGFVQKYTLGLFGIPVQYVIVDGLTAMGKMRYALPASFFRKSIFIVCIFLLPMITDVENLFYSESISDIIGASFTLFLFLCILRKKLKAELCA